MARTVREIMNPELLALGPATPSDEALEIILAHGVSAAPVLDDDGRPLGVTSLRDILRPGEPKVSTPALAISADATIEHAARTMAEIGRHHLVVVGGDGAAIGMLSSMDLVRELVGLPPKHPSSFPHLDATLGVAWTDVTVLDAAHVLDAPEGPGVLVLSAGGTGRSETDVWAEACTALRARVSEIVRGEEPPPVAAISARASLRFRCARVAEEEAREVLARTFRVRIQRAL